MTPVVNMFNNTRIFFRAVYFYPNNSKPISREMFDYHTYMFGSLFTPLKNSMFKKATIMKGVE